MSLLFVHKFINNVNYITSYCFIFVITFTMMRLWIVNHLCNPIACSLLVVKISIWDVLQRYWNFNQRSMPDVYYDGSNTDSVFPVLLKLNRRFATNLNLRHWFTNGVYSETFSGFLFITIQIFYLQSDVSLMWFRVIASMYYVFFIYLVAPAMNLNTFYILNHYPAVFGVIFKRLIALYFRYWKMRYSTLRLDIFKISFIFINLNRNKSKKFSYWSFINFIPNLFLVDYFWKFKVTYIDKIAIENK